VATDEKKLIEAMRDPNTFQSWARRTGKTTILIHRLAEYLKHTDKSKTYLGIIIPSERYFDFIIEPIKMIFSERGITLIQVKRNPRQILVSYKSKFCQLDFIPRSRFDNACQVMCGRVPGDFRSLEDDFYHNIDDVRRFNHPFPMKLTDYKFELDYEFNLWEDIDHIRKGVR
jgi:hypothetical protein